MVKDGLVNIDIYDTVSVCKQNVYLVLQLYERWCVAQSSMNIVALTLPSGYHGRNSMNDNIDIAILLISVDVLVKWSMPRNLLV